MHSKLKFVKAQNPFCDFIVHARRRRKKNLFSQKMPTKYLRIGLRNISFVHHTFCKFGNVEVFVSYPNDASYKVNNLIFSGYLQHQGKMYLGARELPVSIGNSDVLENLDGHFTFAYLGNDCVTVTQDSFGKDMLFYCIEDDYLLVSNRYHLLLLYQNWMGFKPSINYNKILLLMASEVAHFNHCGATRDMFFENQFILTMTEKIVIDKSGFRIAEKTKVAEVFQVKPEAELSRLFEQGVEEIKENGKAPFSRKWKNRIRVDITGGFDSRISLAAVLSSGNRDFDVTTLMAEYGDVVVSEIITNHFNLTRGSTNIYPHLTMEFQNALCLFRSYSMGFYFQKQLTHVYAPLGFSTLWIKGQFGEMYKNYLMRIYLSKEFFSNLTIEQLVSKLVDKMHIVKCIECNHYLKKTLKQALVDELSKMPGNIAQEKFSNHWTYHHARSHFGNSNLSLSLVGLYWSPLTSLSAFAYHNSLPYHSRFKRHPSIVNADLAHAVFPALSEVPYSVDKGNKYIIIPPSPKQISDVTHIYKNYDISAWNTNRQLQAELFQDKSVQYAKDEQHRVSSEERKLWEERTDLSYLLKETLDRFDCLSSISSEMSLIFSNDLRSAIKTCGNSSKIDSYYARILILSDILDCYNLLPSQGSSGDIAFVDETLRPSKTFHNGEMFDSTYNAEKIVNDGGVYLVGGEYAPFPSGTLATKKVAFEMPMTNESKVELFSMGWLQALLVECEYKKSTKYWEVCENALIGYYTYLVWGPKKLWVERQILPYDTETAYGKRMIVVSHMLKLSPECWYFGENAVKIIKQHYDYLKIQKCQSSNDEFIKIGLQYAMDILK